MAAVPERKLQHMNCLRGTSLRWPGATRGRPCRSRRFSAGALRRLGALARVLGFAVPLFFAGGAAAVAMECSPFELFSSGELTLSFPGKHGGELGVLTPSHSFLYLVYEQEEGAPPPLLRPAEFMESRELRLPVADLRGWGASSPNAGSPVRVFSEPGLYRFVVGENLETEDEAGGNTQCEVRLRVLERGARRLP